MRPARVRSHLGPAFASICLTVWVGGCIVQTEPPAPVVVEFVNQTSFDVQPNFYASDTATTATALFVAANLDTSFINRPFPEMRAGETASISLACDEVASFGVNRPESFDAINVTVTVSDDQIFLLRDTQYTCGTTVRFVYFTEGETLRVRAEFPQ